MGELKANFDSMTLLTLTSISTVVSVALFRLLRDQPEVRPSCPRSDDGILETIKHITGSDYPFYVLETARNLKSDVFCLNLPSLIFGKTYMVAESKLANELLTDPKTTKPKHIYGVFSALSNGFQSVFTTNGNFWHSRRKGMAPAFSSRNVKRMNAVAAEKVDDWIQNAVPQFIERGEPFDVAKEMINITLSAISETAFQYKMSKEEKDSFVLDLHKLCVEFTAKSTLNPLRKPLGLLIPQRREAFRASKRNHAISLRILNSYRQLKNPIKDTIIDRIINNSAYSNDDERAADVTTLLVAGHDTTGLTLAWILKELAKNPEEQHKLYNSLKQTNREDWDQSDSLRKVIKEGMRLHCVAAGGSVREIGRDFISRKGYLLPKGAFVFIPYFVMLRNARIFEDADQFVPSRWDCPTKEMIEAFMPFAAGKQNCVGQSLAVAEIYSIIPRICFEYELELVEEGHVHFALTLEPVKTMLKAKKRTMS
jgi:cytochrome P450